MTLCILYAALYTSKTSPRDRYISWLRHKLDWGLGNLTWPKELRRQHFRHLYPHRSLKWCRRHELSYSVLFPASSALVFCHLYALSMPRRLCAVSHSFSFPHSHVAPCRNHRYVMLQRCCLGRTVPSGSVSVLRALIPCVQCNRESPPSCTRLLGGKSTSTLWPEAPSRNCMHTGEPSDSE